MGTTLTIPVFLEEHRLARIKLKWETKVVVDQLKHFMEKYYHGWMHMKDNNN